MKTLDFYEFAGVVCPGATVLYCISRIWPTVAPVLTDKDFGIGGLGLFLVLAYVAGHLVQAFGNILEPIFWKLFGGIPTNWIVRRPGKLLSNEQTVALTPVLRSTLGINIGSSVAGLTSKEWLPISRQIYAALAAAGRTQRVDTFNGNYGMFRGLACGFAFCAMVELIVHWPGGWLVSLGLFAGAILALVRMYRFGVHYARELFVQFLQLQPSTPTP